MCGGLMQLETNVFNGKEGWRVGVLDPIDGAVVELSVWSL